MEDVVVALVNCTVEFLKVRKPNDITSIRTVKTASHCHAICPMSDTTFLMLSYHDKHPLKSMTIDGVERKFNNLPKKRYGYFDCSCTYIRNKDIAVLTDTINDAVRIYEFRKDGVVSLEVKDNEIKRPRGVCVGPDDCLFIYSSGTDSIVQVSLSGKIVATHEVPFYPNKICVSKDGNKLTVASSSYIQSFRIC